MTSMEATGDDNIGEVRGGFLGKMPTSGWLIGGSLGAPQGLPTSDPLLPSPRAPTSVALDGVDEELQHTVHILLHLATRRWEQAVIVGNCRYL